MSIKTTRKEIKRNFCKIYAVGYCELQSLFKNISHDYYVTRVEGWACDVFIIDNVAITTGYSTFGESVPYNLCKKYERKAENINGDYKRSWNSQCRGLKRLQANFLKELKNL